MKQTPYYWPSPARRGERPEPGQVVDTDLIPAEACTEFVQDSDIDDPDRAATGMVVGVLLGLIVWAVLISLHVAGWI